MNLPTFHFVTLFPDFIHAWMGKSILGRAFDKKVFDYHVYSLRDFSTDKYRSVDDVAYGGGGGMVLKVDCLVRATEFIRTKTQGLPSKVIYFSPGGKSLNQLLIQDELSQLQTHHFILICGHYEGVDQRFIDHWVDEEISLGDFVLTGGELPALCFADAICRQLEGTLKTKEASQQESFLLTQNGKPLLEYPHYTRPLEFQGHQVPEVLLSGNHQEISKWREKKALEATQAKRPDLLK